LHPQPNRFTHPALDAVPSHSLSESPPDGETEAIMF
jgi:hypothetical protein